MIKIGNRISLLRKEKGWSQSDLADKVNASREAIGKYERNEAAPSFEVVKKIADTLEVSLDYLTGEGANAKLDKKTVKRLQEIENLPQDDKEKIFYLIDAFIRDAKARKAHAV